MTRPPDAAAFVVVVSGPSGAGKDTVIRAALAQDDSLATVVTVKTRPPRPGEIDGVHQVFLSEAEFDEWLRDDRFLEHAHVYDHRSGVPRDAVDALLRDGKIVILRTDVQGARTLKRRVADPLLVFITAPPDALARRMQERAGDSPDEIAKRLRAAQAEIAEADWFDVVIVNEDGRQDEASAALLEAVRAERVARAV